MKAVGFNHVDQRYVTLERFGRHLFNNEWVKLKFWGKALFSVENKLKNEPVLPDGQSKPTGGFMIPR